MKQFKHIRQATRSMKSKKQREIVKNYLLSIYLPFSTAQEQNLRK